MLLDKLERFRRGAWHEMLLRPRYRSIALSAGPACHTVAALQESYQSRQEALGWESPASTCLAALVGAAAAFSQSSLCDASKNDGNSILQAARQKVLRAYAEIDQDLYRQEAALPFAIDFPPSKPPDVQFKAGTLSIKVPVRSGVDLTALVVDLISCLGGQPDSNGIRDGRLTIEAAECGAARVFNLYRASPPGLTVKLHIPKQKQQAAQVEFLTQGALSDADVSIIKTAMRAANTIMQEQTFQGRTRIWSGGFSSADMEGLLGQHFGALFQEGLEPLMRKMDGELRRLLDPPQSVPLHNEESEGFCLRPGASGEQMRQQAEASTSGSKADYGSAGANAAVQQLETLGAVVYPPGKKDAVDWGLLAGYEEQKEQIEETLLLSLLHPEVYDDVSSRTRRHGGSNRPRAVLFEGPPGTGKTTSARVLSTQASVPLVYVPVEAIASKWYGESEHLLRDIFKAAEQLQGCLIFLDEIDSLATSRGSEMHEATRRILGVLLRQLDGFEGKRSIVIAATNRKQDLDAALLSRFDTSVHFQLPNLVCRQQILKQYAQQLSAADIAHLAGVCDGMSGRDLRDVCEQAERRTASKIVREQMPKGSLPGLQEYMEAAKQRAKSKASERGSYGALTLPRSSFVS